jgi:integrase/recombinase XerC
LVAANVADLNDEDKELRVAWEKGKPGRVLPVAAWAYDIIRSYRDEARPLLMAGRQDTDALFPGELGERISESAVTAVLRRLVAATIATYPDLTELPAKRISTHSLRVSCAKILHYGGISLRSLNALLLHEKLSTTAAYTPVSVEDLRRVLQSAHPRA